MHFGLIKIKDDADFYGEKYLNGFKESFRVIQLLCIINRQIDTQAKTIVRKKTTRLCAARIPQHMQEGITSIFATWF